MRLQSSYLLGVPSLEYLIEPEDWLLKWLTQMAIGRSGLHHIGLSIGCLNPHDVTTCFSQCQWSKHTNWNRTVFYDAASKVTLHPFYNILLFTQASPIHVGGDTNKGMNSEAILGAGYLWQIYSRLNNRNGFRALLCHSVTVTFLLW